MGGFVEDRKRRLVAVAKILSKELEQNNKADYEDIIFKVQMETGVTDHKAREYLTLVVRSNNLETVKEETKTGRRYWILPKKV